MMGRRASNSTTFALRLAVVPLCAAQVLPCGANLAAPPGYTPKAGSGPCRCDQSGPNSGMGLKSCGALCCANSPLTNPCSGQSPCYELGTPAPTPASTPTLSPTHSPTPAPTSAAQEQWTAQCVSAVFTAPYSATCNGVTCNTRSCYQWYAPAPSADNFDTSAVTSVSACKSRCNTHQG